MVAILREANSAEESDCAGTLVDLFLVHINNYNLSYWKGSGTQKALEVLRCFVLQKKKTLIVSGYSNILVPDAKFFISLILYISLYESPQIGSRWIVTAAHCVFSNDKEVVFPLNV